MKYDYLKAGLIKPEEIPCCCPGHDEFSSEAYRNNRSKRAMARGKRRWHRIARRRGKLQLSAEVRAVD